jgi:hypothetical protein
VTITQLPPSGTCIPAGSCYCLNYTELAGPGEEKCPEATTGFSTSKLLAGPTPANGATVTNLYADSTAHMPPGSPEGVLVAVIDNTTGATLLSCTVSSPMPSGGPSGATCSNASGSGTAAAGDNIEVRLTAQFVGPGNNEKAWRVRFRY